MLCALYFSLVVGLTVPRLGYHICQNKHVFLFISKCSPIVGAWVCVCAIVLVMCVLVTVSLAFVCMLTEMSWHSSVFIQACIRTFVTDQIFVYF